MRAPPSPRTAFLFSRIFRAAAIHVAAARRGRASIFCPLHLTSERMARSSHPRSKRSYLSPIILNFTKILLIFGQSPRPIVLKRILLKGGAALSPPRWRTISVGGVNVAAPPPPRISVSISIKNSKNFVFWAGERTRLIELIK